MDGAAPTSGATVLVAGASGALGREVARHLLARGYSVRALSRTPERSRATIASDCAIVRADALRGPGLAEAMAGCFAVVSSLGASLDPSPLRGWRSFLSHDLPANARLIDAAREAGVRRFVYVSTFHTDATRQTRYVRAHEGVVERLRASGLSYAVLRPTGFFTAFDMVVRMALRGELFDPGDGRARTNPIHPDDVASACVDALRGDDAERSLGRPQVYRRAEIAEMIARATGARRTCSSSSRRCRRAIRWPRPADHALSPSTSRSGRARWPGASREAFLIPGSTEWPVPPPKSSGASASLRQPRAITRPHLRHAPGCTAVAWLPTRASLSPGPDPSWVVHHACGRVSM